MCVLASVAFKRYAEGSTLLGQDGGVKPGILKISAQASFSQGTSIVVRISHRCRTRDRAPDPGPPSLGFSAQVHLHAAVSENRDQTSFRQAAIRDLRTQLGETFLTDEKFIIAYPTRSSLFLENYASNYPSTITRHPAR